MTETAIMGARYRWADHTEHDDGYTLVLDSMQASCRINARMIHDAGSVGIVTIGAADFKAALDFGWLVPVENGSDSA